MVNWKTMYNQMAQQRALARAYGTVWYDDNQTTSAPTISTWLTNATTTTGTGSVYTAVTSTVGTTSVTQGGGGLGSMRAPDPVFDDGGGRYKLHKGFAYVLELPDGAYLEIGADGSYLFKEDDAKVRYKAAPRDFNPFLNASDKIEDFIKFCGQHGVRKDEMLQLPLKLFIAWLVIEAAKADQEPEPNIPLLPDLRKRTEARCAQCGRFMKRTIKAKQIDVCRVECFEARIAA